MLWFQKVLDRSQRSKVQKLGLHSGSLPNPFQFYQGLHLYQQSTGFWSNLKRQESQESKQAWVLDNRSITCEMTAALQSNNGLWKRKLRNHWRAGKIIQSVKRLPHKPANLIQIPWTQVNMASWALRLAKAGYICNPSTWKAERGGSLVVTS